VSEAVASICKTSETSLQWLALALTPGLGPTKARRVIEFFGSVQALFRASHTELEAAGLRPVSAQSLGTGRSMELAQDEKGKAAAADVRIVALDDAAYPTQLKHLYDPPLILYVRGSETVISQPGSADWHATSHTIRIRCGGAVGLRSRGAWTGNFQPYGTRHRYCRAPRRDCGKGKTVAVWGTGVDVVYPKENTRLVEQILALGGAVISEFPIGTFPAPQNFPIRNRIISGISLGVLVVEAAEYSGARITARCALEQNREVFAVPGDVTHKGSWTPNSLIKQGGEAGGNLGGCLGRTPGGCTSYAPARGRQ
jgi:DNA processing protein